MQNQVLARLGIVVLGALTMSCGSASSGPNGVDGSGGTGGAGTGGVRLQRRNAPHRYAGVPPRGERRCRAGGQRRGRPGGERRCRPGRQRGCRPDGQRRCRPHGQWGFWSVAEAWAGPVVPREISGAASRTPRARARAATSPRPFERQEDHHEWRHAAGVRYRYSRQLRPGHAIPSLVRRPWYSRHGVRCAPVVVGMEGRGDRSERRRDLDRAGRAQRCQRRLVYSGQQGSRLVRRHPGCRRSGPLRRYDACLRNGNEWGGHAHQCAHLGSPEQNPGGHRHGSDELQHLAPNPHSRIPSPGCRPPA